MQSTTSTNSEQAVLGVNTTYDTMLAIESLMLSNTIMNDVRDLGKLSKTSLCKMALMEFISNPVSTRKLRRLYKASCDDEKFRAILQGGSLE